MMTNELYNHAKFFEMILYRACKDQVNQMVTIVEWKHIFGFLFDEDGPIPLDRECAIFERVQEKMKMIYPLFQMKIIACGLKIIGKPHIQT